MTRTPMRRSWTAALAGAGLALILSCCGAAPAEGPPAEPTGGQAPTDRPAPEPAQPPNIVLIQMDDFSADLVPTMRSMAQMRARGAVFTNSFVVDSLCCVSRASAFTGQYPHQTGVETNTANDPAAPVGGYEAFTRYGNDERSFNVRLQEAGYTTGYIGKYLNQYEFDGTVPPRPPGWSQFQVIFGSAYAGWDFVSARTEGGRQRARRHPAPPASAPDQVKDEAYVGTVTQRMALRFIRAQQRRAEPYFLQVAPYAVHSRVSQRAYPEDPPFPPAFRDRPGGRKKNGNCGPVKCLELTTDDLPGFADPVADNAPRDLTGAPVRPWRPDARPSPAVATKTLRDRARMAQSIDRMVRRILASVDENTYVVLTSDNGFHIGQHGLGQGKGAPYDSDVRVPLFVVGPGVQPGERTEMVTNLDLAPTFEDLAGLRPAAFRAGESLVPVLGEPSTSRRSRVFIEHLWAKSKGTDPDKMYSGGTIDAIPTYLAVRSTTGLLVRLEPNPEWPVAEQAWEYYDYTRAGWEQTNTFVDPRDPQAPEELRELYRLLGEFDRHCKPITRDAEVTAECRALTR